MQPVDHSGERHGSRILTRKMGSKRRGKTQRLHVSLYEAVCDCGAIWIGTYHNLKRNRRYCGKCNRGPIRHGLDGTPEHRMWLSARERAKRKSLPFGIEMSDIVIPKICPVLGIPLFPGNRQNHDNAPSLDRIIPRLGYLPYNVRVISHRANSLKHDGTLQEFEMLLQNWNAR